MLASIQRFLFSTPHFPEDDEKTRRARLLHVVLTAQAGVLAFVIVGTLISIFSTGAGRTPELIVMLVASTVIILWRALMWRGQVGMASTGMIIFFLASVTMILVSGGTIRSAGVIYFPLTIVMATILISRRAGLAFFILTSLIGIGLVEGELRGFLPTPENQISLASHAIVVSGMGLATVLLYLASRGTENALELARKNEQEVRSLASTLEQRVIERTKALASSAEVSRRLSTILDPDQLMLEVVEQIKAAYKYYHGQIYLLDEGKQNLILAGATGETGRILMEQGHSVPIEQGLVGRVARTKTAVVVPDTAKAPDWLPNLLLPETKAEVAVPIILSGQVLGVLDMQDDVVGDVFDEDAELLQAIANQVAIALQNTRQYEEIQLLFQASQAVSTATNYQEMLEAFMAYAAPQADQGGLLVFNSNEEGDLLAVDYAAAWSRHADQSQPVQIGTRFAPEQIPFISFFDNNQPLIVADVHATTPGPQTTSPEIAAVLTQFGVQSVAGFPLMLGGKLLGAMLFGYAHPHTFTERELQPVQAIASQVAVLLRNQQLLAETQTALAQLDIINRRLTGEGWGEFTKLYGGFTVEDVVPGISQTLLEEAIQDSKNGHMDSIKEIAVPIAVHGEEIGLFSLQHLDEVSYFTDEDLELLQAVADDVAVGLENIRLLEETQQNAIALEESRNLLDAVIENLPLLLFVKEAKELRYVRWNKAGETMLGISAVEVLGKNAYDSFTKEEADRFTAQDWKILSGEKFLNIVEETVETPRGTRILHTRKFPVYGPDGQSNYLIGLSEDITERKQAEQALRDLEALYRRAIASADAVPYSRRYEDETYTFVGVGIEQLTGYTPEEFTAALFDNMILETIVHSSEASSHDEAVRLTRSGIISHWKADYRIFAKNGEEHWLADTSVEVLDSEGRSTGSVGILTDITEQKRNEAALNRQLLEMESLNELGQILTSQADLNEMLIQAGRKICETFNVDTGSIALYDSRSELFNSPFYLNAGKRLDFDPKPLRVGLASHIIRGRQPLFIPAMTEEISKKLGAIVDGVPAASWLGAPIMSGDEVIGVVSVQHNEEPNWFKDSDVRYLTTIAANLSTAILNIRLFEQTQTTLTELEQLTRRLTREGWDGYLNTLAAEIGYVYDLNKITPVEEVHKYSGDGALEKPLFVQGEEIGRLFVAETENAGDEADEILEAVSKQLSAHIENLRLLEETDRGRTQLNKRATELAIVAEVGTTTATILNPDELLQKVVELTKESFDLYHAHIYLTNQEKDVLTLTAGAGEVGRQMLAEGWNIPINHELSIVAGAFRNQQSITANDINHDKGSIYLSHRLLPNTRSELALPLVVGENILGVFDVQSDVADTFTEDYVNIYTTLASQVAVALQNARLYTEQAATVQRLRELDHLKSSFLANMSHELRTPLNSIIGFTEIIMEGIDGPLTEYMEGDLKIIQKNGRHLLSLINDVLDMAKIEAGRMNLTYERFLLRELLEDVVDITSSLAHDKNLYLKIEGDSAVETELVADRIRLRQVLINLVGNAVKFTETGGVTLRSEKKDGKLWLKVIDTGMGIPPDKVETVFDHFSQVDTSTTRKVGGTGLGLPISRRLVELHQGQLYAESSGKEGEGSTFIMVLPLEQPKSS
ncbi:MAG TPA: GAF domain-containing protein [Anaerolineales bacterium]|nr:GAF domain-containing protein [Anaerolineales bacterium]